MKKKKIIYIVLVILLLIGGGIFFIISKQDNSNTIKKEEEKKTSTATPLLYEVTKEGSDNKIYLFGSIHAADDRAYPLPDTVISAYNESNYLAVEFDIVDYSTDFEAQSISLQKFLCTNGQTLKDTMHSDTYDLLISYMKDNKIYNNMYEYYRPVFLYTLISNEQTEKTELKSSKGIDTYFLKQAKKDKKEILEIESAEYQYNLLASFPDELFDLIIKYSIQNENETIESTKMLYEAWLNGDMEKIITLSNEESELVGEYDEYTNMEEMLEDYSEKLIYKRNNEMAEKTKTYFEDGKKVFLVVGAAHIVGEDGLVDLLTQKGYEVNQIEYQNSNK